jgi:hypothetical protein
MLERRVMAGSQKQSGLAVWKRLILIAGMLLPGGIFAVFVPSQAAYAQSPFVCGSAPGGNGGLANHGSSGADGASGGGCVNGLRGGDANAGGQNNSPGGGGGNVY